MQSQQDMQAADEPDDRRRRGARHAADHPGARGSGRRGRRPGRTGTGSDAARRDHRGRVPVHPEPTRSGRRSRCWASSSAWAPSSPWWRWAAARRRRSRTGSRRSAPTCSPSSRAKAASGAVMITDRTVLSTDDSEALQRDAHLLEAVVPEAAVGAAGEVRQPERNLNIIGTTANYADVQNYTVPYGRMFTAGDDDARQRYAVLGSVGARDAGRQRRGHDRSDHPDPRHPVRDHRRPEPEGLGGRVPEPRRADPDPAADGPVPGLRQQTDSARSPSR